MKKRIFDMDVKGRRFALKCYVLVALVSVILIASILVATAPRTRISSTSATSLLCTLAAGSRAASAANYVATPTQLQAIVHYATSRVVPQQNLEEITLSFDVLRDLSPCNFLVFGLGHDSLMWAALNPRGTTLFLEEDPGWIKSVLQRAPMLRALHVEYPTRLSEADDLLSSYTDEPDCVPPRARIGTGSRCRLALPGLPDEVYDKEWDVIMIDAPRGYFDAAPGRMGAIFTAAVMARRRVKEGVTHVYLHDVDRRVEKIYAEEFLCMKYKTEGAGRLWHFEIPPSSNISDSKFC